MKKKWMFLPIAIAFAGCAPDMPSKPKQVAAQAEVAASAATTRSVAQDEDRKGMDATVPVNFSEYAAASAGDDKRCVAGASVDDDGLNQKPVLYVSGRDQKDVLWSKTLPLPPDTYQSRATHCFGTDGSLYVLIQSDTQPEQTLSQTLLRVLKVDPNNGAVLASADVEPAGVADAHSSWVEEGPENFRLQGDKLVVAGKYYRLTDAEERKPFEVELDSSLNR
jgi:hypothetical protein